jgi:hypothetical protein
MLCGCLGEKSTSDRADENESSGGPFAGLFSRGTEVPAGTVIKVRLGSKLTSETASAGDEWTGVVTRSIVIDGKTLIPAGSTARGVVAGAREAKRGTRAMLDLALRSVTANGRKYAVIGAAGEVVAGSPRARNVGAIAGGAAAGALIGKAVGGDGKDAAIGGLVGGAAATAVVAKSKGYQVVLEPGTVMSFTTRDPVRVR